MKNNNKKIPVVKPKNNNLQNNTPIDGEKKVKKKNYLPINQLGFSELGKNILHNWDLVFPNLSALPLFNKTQLEDTVANFANNIIQAQNLDNDKRANSQQLNNLNAKINKMATLLRQYVREEYINTDAQAVQFAFYGMQQDSRGAYIVPRDNDSRQQSLQRLRAYIANSLFANRKFGLSEWTTAQLNHDAYWQESERLRQARSGLTAILAEQFADLKEKVKYIHQYIKIAFAANEVAAKRREIGFLKESF